MCRRRKGQIYLKVIHIYTGLSTEIGLLWVFFAKICYLYTKNDFYVENCTYKNITHYNMSFMIKDVMCE